MSWLHLDRGYKINYCASGNVPNQDQMGKSRKDESKKFPQKKRFIHVYLQVLQVGQT